VTALRIAILGLSGCDGCQYNLVREDFLNFLRSRGIEVAYWPLVGAEEGSGEYDVALVEGSVISGRDLEVLKSVRSRSRVLVALGACATLGGVQTGLGFSRPLASYVRVDYYLRGCPVEVGEVLDLLDKLSRGLPAKFGERRFDHVERPTRVIADGLIELDGSKCITCGRCIEVCRRVGAHVLNYFRRGIETEVVTPYGEPFSKAGCVLCGLCAAYCPAGAVSYRLDIEEVLQGLREGSLVSAYVEPEALASLAESEGLTPQQVVAALKALGFRYVVVYDPLSELGRVDGVVVARSPAEERLLRRYLPEVRVELPRPAIPPGAVYVTQCLSWKAVGLRAITARELQLAIRRLNYPTLGEERPDSVLWVPGAAMRRVGSLDELRRSLGGGCGGLVLEVCPGGCLLGGGQPLTPCTDLGEVLARRRARLEELAKLRSEVARS
jgi:coenzyme F420-reducing hydrogenase gamma subunit